MKRIETKDKWEFEVGSICMMSDLPSFIDASHERYDYSGTIYTPGQIVGETQTLWRVKSDSTGSITTFFKSTLREKTRYRFNIKYLICYDESLLSLNREI